MRRTQETRKTPAGRKTLILALVVGLNLAGAGAALAGDFQPGHHQIQSSTAQNQPAISGAPAGAVSPVVGAPSDAASAQSQEPHTEVENRIREGEGRSTRHIHDSTL
ncbi:hypothetical protein SAMN04488693_13111 [Arthrobacter subterraneus]|uniref:Uncharacterized protein n=1 Tax=Arthrobacter subterraneus TaxID=335973 RepID=A0A1G8P9V2_9MICC|nr:MULTISPECIES: hypothetical protein [Arthrobacter]SDI89293.1 hypothetical protein SAMN04488693_13111 [Arthrobacter subterraneus]